MTTGRKLLIALAAVLAAVVIAGGIKLAIDYDRAQKRIDAAQLQEFKADLETNGFDRATTNIVWKDDPDCTGGNCSSDREMDGNVWVGGCPFQVERSEAQADESPEKVFGVSQMKPYKLDEYADGSKDGVDVTERGRDGRLAFTIPNPTAKQVYDYVVQYKGGVFKRCYDPKAPVPTT